MTRALGPTLSPALVERLSQRDLERRLGVGLGFVTVDAAGCPHPMLVSYLEVKAYDARTLGLVIQARSASARNLAERGVGTLVVIEPERSVYVKARATGPPLRAGELARFTLAVEDVLEDSPDPGEGDVAITSGIHYGPPPALDDARAKAVLAALRAG